MKNYYQILGILHTAESIVVKAAYKALAQRYHPDKNPEKSDEYKKKMSTPDSSLNIFRSTSRISFALLGVVVFIFMMRFLNSNDSQEIRPNDNLEKIEQSALAKSEEKRQIFAEEASKGLVTPDADNQRLKFNYYALERPLLSNLAGSRKVMQVTLTIMTHYDDRVIKNVKTHELALREGILGVMRKKTEADLRDADFRRTLAEEIRLTINSLLEKYEGFGGIEEVMCTEFIVQ